MTAKLTRRLAAIAGTAALAGGAGLWAAGPAAADTPTATGWWSFLRQTTPAGSVPSTTQQNDGSLPVQNGPNGVTEFSALRYTTQGASGGTLTLKFAGQSPAQPPKIVACATTAAWHDGADQTWDQRPGYDCKSKVEGKVSGGSVTWQIGSDLTSMPGTFDFVLVPDPADSTPFSVTFAKPGAASFTPQGGGGYGSSVLGSDGSGSGVLASPSAAAAAPGSGSGSAGSLDTSGLSASSNFAPPPDPGSAPTVAGPEGQSAPAGQGVPPQVAGRQAAAVQPASGNARLLGVGIIAATVLLLMFLMANPTALGSVTPRRLVTPGQRREDAAPDPYGSPARVGGVGRFVRERSGPPVRL